MIAIGNRRRRAALTFFGRPLARRDRVHCLQTHPAAAALAEEATAVPGRVLRLLEHPEQTLNSILLLTALGVRVLVQPCWHRARTVLGVAGIAVASRRDLRGFTLFVGGSQDVRVAAQ